MYLLYPYNLDGRGRTATADDDAHVRQLIEQVLFTSPGERVNRPTFGCGLAQLVFAPNGSVLAEATQFLVQSSLQEWLAEVITVESVEVSAEESTLSVRVAYLVKRTGRRVVAELERGAP